MKSNFFNLLVKDSNFIPFSKSELNLDIPNTLISPYEKTIHPLAKLASRKLQQSILELGKINSNFSFNKTNTTQKTGKMFGVLIVENKAGNIGFLQAFSGNLGKSNRYFSFVPPVIDLIDESNFFNKGMSEIAVLTLEINSFKSSDEFINSKKNYDKALKVVALKKQEFRIEKIKLKQSRNKERAEANRLLKEKDLDVALNLLSNQSRTVKALYKAKEKELFNKVLNLKNDLNTYTLKLDKLKEYRKQKSNSLQHALFDQYLFLNVDGEQKYLREIFEDTKGNLMPAGAGECSAPKLFQYAFKYNYKPLILAEFWWGETSKSDKLHQHFYPPCKEKCEPILEFMLRKSY